MHQAAFHFVYDKQKRNGMLLLIGLIFCALGVLYWYEPPRETLMSQKEQEELVVFLERIDSLKAIAQKEKEPRQYPFNPNFISDYKGFTLGMSTEEVDRLHRFRESGKWINSKEDFQRITQVSDSLLAQLAPWFKFPDWVTNPRPSKKRNFPQKQWKTKAEKRALNAMTPEALIALDGVTMSDADRIIRYREKIGGFLIDQQVYDVYGVSSKVKRQILHHYTVKQAPQIEKLPVNTASASDLATIPGLSYELAVEIVHYRTLHEGIKSLEELRKIEGMTSYKFDRIGLYLKID